MENIETAFNKAAEGLAKAAAPEGQAAPAPETSQTKTADTAPVAQAVAAAPDAKAEDKAPKEWDGKNETLAAELKQDPKAIQRAYTRKAMEAAEAQKKLQEFQGLDKQEIEQYRQWKQQQEYQRQQQLIQQPPAPSQLTAEQYEFIKNDPAAMTAYIQAQVNTQIQQAAQTIVPEINALRYENTVKTWESTISDFGEVHPEMWDMHKVGFFAPILEAEVKAGGGLDSAYQKASTIWNSMKAKAEADAQAGVAAKRNAASLPGTTSGSDDAVIYADNSRDALEKAFDLAVSKKESVPQGQIISPRGRVKVRK